MGGGIGGGGGGTNNFLGETQYTATVTLTAKSGYIFDDSISATINTYDAIITHNGDSTVTLSYTFQATLNKIIESIIIVDQPQLEYTHGASLNLSALKVRLIFDDKTQTDVNFISFSTYGISAEPENGTQLVYSMYKDTAVDVKLSSFLIKTNPLEISKATPTANYFDFGAGTFTYDGNPKAVSITAKQDGMGSVTVKYYSGNSTTTTPPSNAGTYIVTFDVAEGANYNTASGLEAGTLTINKATPTADDFNISNLTQTFGGITPVSISPKQGKSNGSINIYYRNSNGNQIADLPTTIGNYIVTFNVTESSDGNWSAANGLEAGTLTINNALNQLQSYLSTLDENDVNSPYPIKLNITNENDLTNLATVLKNNQNANKFVSLDLSGSTITSIPYEAFQDCQNLTGVILPNNLASILSFAFQGTSLNSITIPDSVSDIYISAFFGCTTLTEINVSTDNNNYTSVNGVLYNKSKSTLIAYPAGKIGDFVMENEVKIIGSSAFSNCTNLTNVILSENVITIKSSAFYGTSLNNITIPKNVVTIGSYAFSDCNNLVSVKFESSMNEGWGGEAETGFLSGAFGSTTAGGYIGDLHDKYFATGGGIGTYTRATNGTEWTKTP
ncbi:leucine-rich repeat protein [Treponema sp. R6D11]